MICLVMFGNCVKIEKAPPVFCAAVVGSTTRGSVACLTAAAAFPTTGATLSGFVFPSVHKNKKMTNQRIFAMSVLVFRAQRLKAAA